MSTRAALHPGRRQAPAAGTYLIDAHRSTVTLTTSHLFGLGVVRAGLRLRAGRLVVADALEESTVTVVVDTGSFTSGNRDRDRSVRGPRLLDAGRFPDVSFDGHGVRPAAAGWEVPGRLEVRGLRSQVTVVVTDCGLNGDTLAVRATCTVDRVSAGVRRARGLAGRRVLVDLDVRASRLVAEAGR